MTRPCNVPPMFQQPFRPPFFFFPQGIGSTPIIVIISFPYLQNTTVFYQNKFNKNLKSLKAQHGVQIISGPDCRKTPGLFSATPKSMEGWGGCGAILYPHPEKHRPFFRYPSHSLIQQPTSPGHPGDQPPPPSPRRPKQPPAPPELLIGTQKEHRKPPNHCNHKESC